MILSRIRCPLSGAARQLSPSRGRSVCAADEQAADTQRSAALKAHGYAVLRFPNIDIDRRFRAACEAIGLEIKRRIPQ